MRKYLPDLAGLYGVLIFPLLVIFKGATSLGCGDTYWHIKIGQVMLDRGELLKQDIFSHTAFGKPWVAHEWLSELLMAVLYNAGGLPAVTLVFLFVATLAYYLLLLTARQLTDDWSMIMATALALPLTFTHLLIRPHLFTWLFGALTLYLLSRQQRLLWLLPVITALWANLHGGFVFGLFLQGIFSFGRLLDDWPGRSWNNWRQWLRDNRRTTAILVLSILASGINPYGYRLLWFPIEINNPVFTREIGEWMSLDLQQNWYFRLWIILILILASLHFRKTAWGWRLLILFLVYQALGQARHVSIAALFTLPWLAMALQKIRTEVSDKPQGGMQLPLSSWSGPFIVTLLFLGLFMTNLYRPAIWQQFANSHFTPPSTFSPRLVEYLSKGYPGDRLLNEYSLGGFLLFSLQDPPRVFIDGRADMYGDEIFSDYVDLARIKPGFESLLDKYRIDWIVFPNDHHLTRFLLQTPDWQRIYQDDHLSILTKRETAERLSKPVGNEENSR